MKDVPELLFVCVHNAGRSQMAAGLLDHHAGGRVHVRSASSAPVDEINPAVVAAMHEKGVDLSKEFPKPLTTDVVEAADVVVTMGYGDVDEGSSPAGVTVGHRRYAGKMSHDGGALGALHEQPRPQFATTGPSRIGFA